MDKAFLNIIRKNSKEFNLGLYEEGRYAWIFDNIEPIILMPAKGKLNMWNYDYEVTNIVKN